MPRPSCYFRRLTGTSEEEFRKLKALTEVQGCYRKSRLQKGGPDSAKNETGKTAGSEMPVPVPERFRDLRAAALLCPIYE